MWRTTRRVSCVPLSDAERRLLAAAGTTASPTARQQAVSVLLAKHGDDLAEAREVLAAGFVRATQPSFHLIPRGDAMASEGAFTVAYDVLDRATSGFTDVNVGTIAAALREHPASLAPLRMILGLTHGEFAVAMKLVDPECRVGAGSVKSFERKPRPAQISDRRARLIEQMAATAISVMERAVLAVPDVAEEVFHSKLDKRDTRKGWESVAADAAGVPYSALLYQRYVGGVWRQVQDAYSEVKGDNLLELPIETLFRDEGIPYYRTPSGARGAAEARARYNLNPGPDFVLPDDPPSVILESKVGEDGGTVRDKAARIQAMAEEAHRRRLTAVAVVDGKGWSERPNALVDVVIATGGLTYTLDTLPLLLQVPQIAALRP